MERVMRVRAAVTDVVLSSLGSAGAQSTGDVPYLDMRAAELISRVLNTLLFSVGGDAAGLWEHVRGGWSTPLFLTPPDIWRRLPYGRTLTSEAAKIHPGVRHCLEDFPTTPFTVTDLITERDWQSSKIGRKMQAQWGRNYQLMIPVDTGSPSSTFWVWVAGRQRVDFGRDDRQVALALQPVLTAVTRQYTAIKRLAAPVAVTHVLTPREHAVFILLLDGRPSDGVAARLEVSPRTVHKHIERIYRKLGVHDRGSLIEWASRQPQRGRRQ